MEKTNVEKLIRMTDGQIISAFRILEGELYTRGYWFEDHDTQNMLENIVICKRIGNKVIRKGE